MATTGSPSHPGTSASLPGRLVRTASALSRLGLFDVRGHLSARLDASHVLVTPRAGERVPPPASLSAADLLAVDLRTGDVVEGRWSVPPDLPLSLAIFRARPDVQAVALAQPPTALAFAAADRPLLPLTHTESALVLPRLPVFGRGELLDTPERGSALAGALGDRPLALLPGQGVRWEAVDANQARATLTDDAVSVTLQFRFNADGLIDTVHAEARGRTVGKRIVPTPWQGRFWNYQTRSGMLVPLEGEVEKLIGKLCRGSETFERQVHHCAREGSTRERCGWRLRCCARAHVRAFTCATSGLAVCGARSFGAEDPRGHHGLHIKIDMGNQTPSTPPSVALPSSKRSITPCLCRTGSIAIVTTAFTDIRRLSLGRPTPPS